MTTKNAEAVALVAEDLTQTIFDWNNDAWDAKFTYMVECLIEMGTGYYDEEHDDEIYNGWLEVAHAVYNKISF